MEKELTYIDLVQRVNELEKDKLELKRAEETLRLIAEDTARLTGKEFIRNLVKQLALAIGFRWVFVGNLVAQNLDCINTIVFWADGEYADNFKYDLSGTPCRNVVKQSFCFYPKDIQRKFPQDQMLAEMGVESYMGIPLINSSGNTIGLLVAMDDKSMEKLAFAQPIMRIFAQRIVAELERMQINRDLERKHQIQRVLNELLSISLKPYHLEKMLDLILEHIISIPWLVFESKAAILLAENKADVLILKSFREFSKDAQISCAEIPFGKCLCGQAAQTKKIVFADYIDSRHEILYKNVSPHGHYCVPILSSGKVYGVLNLYVKDGHQRKKEEEDLLISVANVLAGIIERKRAEDELWRSNERFRNLVETTSDFVWEVDEKGIYSYVNPQLTNILGYDVDEVVGKTPFHLMPQEEAQRVKSIFNNIVAERKPLKALENINIHKDGHHIILETSGVPVFDADGTFKGYRGIDRDITKRKRAEEELKKAYDRLEMMVVERTHELTETNKQLKNKILEQAETEKELKQREDELRIKTVNLEETNTALRVLLKKREEDKSDIEEKILDNVKELVLPYLEKIKKNISDSRTDSYLHILESNLNDITSSFSFKMTSKYLNLTPTEIQVANLIKHGSNTKEIAEVLCLSTSTIGFHRKNIRKKLGIKNKKTNLRTQLISLN